MEENSHLIRRTTLDLSLNNGKLGEEVSSSYKEFFQKILLPILEEELDKAGIKDVVQIDKWELDLGDVMLNDSEFSETVFHELESRFRSEIKKKLKGISAQKNKYINPIEILQEFLIHGSTENSHFIEIQGLNDFFSKLSLAEKKKFLDLVKRNRHNSEFLKRILGQFMSSDLDLLFQELSSEYSEEKKRLLKFFDQNFRAQNSISKTILLEGFRRFWFVAWSVDELHSNISWNKVLDETLIEDLEKISGNTKIQQSADLLTAKLDEISKADSLKRSVRSESFEDLDHPFLNKGEERKKVLTYFLKYGSLPIEYKNLSVLKIKELFIEANPVTLKSLKNKLPNSASHKFWLLFNHFSVVEINQLLKNTFSESYTKIQKLNADLQVLHRLQILDSKSTSFEILSLKSILQAYLSKPKFVFQISNDLIENLENNGVETLITKSQINQIKPSATHKSHKKIIDQFSLLIEDRQKGDKSKARNDKKELQKAKSPGAVDLTKFFLIDFLRFYIQENKLPWWADELDVIHANVKGLKSKTLNEAVFDLARVFYRTSGATAKAEFKSWMSIPKSANNIVFAIDPALKTFILDHVFPSYRQLTLRKFLSLAIMVANSKRDKAINDNNLSEEIIIRLAPKIVQLSDNEIKKSCELVIRSISKLFDLSFEELMKEILDAKQSFLSELGINSTDLQALLTEIERESKLMLNLGEDTGVIQTEVEDLFSDFVIDDESLAKAIIQFLNTGIMKPSLSFQRMESFLENYSDNQNEGNSELIELLPLETTQVILNFIQGQNVKMVESQIIEREFNVDEIEDQKIVENDRKYISVSRLNEVLTVENKLSLPRQVVDVVLDKADLLSQVECEKILEKINDFSEKGTELSRTKKQVEKLIKSYKKLIDEVEKQSKYVANEGEWKLSELKQFFKQFQKIQPSSPQISEYILGLIKNGGQVQIQEIEQLKILIENAQYIKFKDLHKLLENEAGLSPNALNEIIENFSQEIEVDIPGLKILLQESQKIDENTLNEIISIVDEKVFSIEKTISTIDVDSEVVNQENSASKIQEREIEFKSSASTIFAVLRYFFDRKTLPWWSLYEDIADLQVWFKRIKRIDPKAFNEELISLLAVEDINSILSDYFSSPNDNRDLILNEVSGDLQEYTLALKSIPTDKSNYELEERNWFFDKMTDLFSSNGSISYELKKAFALYLIEGESVLDLRKTGRQFEKIFSSFVEEKRESSLILLAELNSIIEGAIEKNNLRNKIKSTLSEGLSWTEDWGDFSSLLNSWMPDSKINAEDEGEIIEDLLYRLTIHIAYVESQTQSNIILKLIRTNPRSKLLQQMQNLSDKLAHNEWYFENEDVKLAHEIFAFGRKVETLKKESFISQNDLYKLYNLIEVVESEMPSLYLLTLYLIKIKETEDCSLINSIQFCKDILSSSESNLDSLYSNLDLLSNSEWVNEAEIQTDYNQLFSNLLMKQNSNQNSSEKEILIENALQILEEDEMFFRYLEESSILEIESKSLPPFEEKINEKWLQIKEGDRVFVSNAGLAMIWPFLTTLFKNLGYLEDKVFKNFESQERAVHLLQFIVDGEEGSPEFLLMFNKILCGIPPNVPIRRFVHLTKDEKDEAILFLTTVIGKWEQMKNTSLEVFRDTFLKRDGALMYKNERWHLKVEYKPIDILLIKLPWGMSMIKYPWFKYLILVEWNNKS